MSTESRPTLPPDLPEGGLSGSESAGLLADSNDGLPEAHLGAGPLFTITELANEFDITARAIRFYEDMGLLTPARAGRNRVYTQRDRTRLKLTLRGKRLGLSLQDVKQLVDMYDSQSDTAPQLRAFLSVLDQHRRQLRQQLSDIEVTLAEISQHEERCLALLAEAGHPAER